jgi:Zn-dependent protease with chaperone function
MAQAPHLDFDGFVSNRRHKSGDEPPPPDTDPARAYAYSFDRKTRETLERFKPVELAVAHAVRLFKEVASSQLLGSAVKVGDNQFPRIHELTKRCAQTLGIKPPTVYIVNSPTLNASALGTNEDAFIAIHAALVDHYSDEELMTVIGHECGHVHNSHVVYLTALYFLTNLASVFVQWIVQPAVIALNAWKRRAEITSDRAGMLCAKDAAVAERALTKLALGSRKLYEEFNLEAFLAQHHEGKDGAGRYTEMFQSHPYLPKRVLAMREFAKSANYRSAVGLDGGVSMAEVDARVAALLKGDA